MKKFSFSFMPEKPEIPEPDNIVNFPINKNSYIQINFTKGTMRKVDIMPDKSINVQHWSKVEIKYHEG